MSMKRAVVFGGAVAMLAACGSSKSEKKNEEPAAPAAAEVQPADEPAAAEPPKAKDGPSREQLAAKALERVPDIQNGVAELRALKFKSAVPAEYQNEAEFRAFVEKEIQRELPPDKAKSMSRALHHIGLLKDALDLPKVLEDAMVSQAGAYYDPAQKKFFLVMVPQSDLILDTISSHELTHALQDQHFDLNRYYYGHDGDGPPKFNEDELNARRFIVEGEATFVMVAYGGYAMAKVNMLEDKFIKQLRPQLEMFAKMDIEQLRTMTQQQASAFEDMGDDFKKSLEAMDKIPLYILVPLLESYMKGVMPVYEAYLDGGWKSVSKLYTDPPNSTEQVLHPATKLVPKRDYPIAVTLPELEGATEVQSEVLGELGWRVYFMLWEPKDVDVNAAAAGWDGDRYTVYEKDGKLVGLIATTWDDQKEADEFADAYMKSLAVRFPEGKASASKGWDAVSRTDGTSVFLRKNGKDVFIVDGDTDGALLDLVSKAKKKRHKKDR
jgi:hypothetical protein